MNARSNQSAFRSVALAAVAIITATLPLHGWHNGGDRTNQPPKFGTHDYIALKALDRAEAPKVTFIRDRLVSYFIGTEAPDTNKKIPGVTEGGYHDSLQCHCVLFREDGTISRAHARDRIRQEFNRAVAALQANQLDRAAFFAGAMAHYVGDLSQIHHLMGAESHWGAEDQQIHKAYENAVDRVVDFRTRTSNVLGPFLRAVTVQGDTPEAIAESVARFTERGGGSANTPGEMNHTLAMLGVTNAGRTASWPAAIREQTGRNVNFAVNGVGRLLGLIFDTAANP